MSIWCQFFILDINLELFSNSITSIFIKCYKGNELIGGDCVSCRYFMLGSGKPHLRSLHLELERAKAHTDGTDDILVKVSPLLLILDTDPRTLTKDECGE